VPIERATWGSFEPPFEMAVGVPLPPIETTVGSYRYFKWRQELNRRFKRRFEAISTHVQSDYLFS
jgi:hypothetical protein